MKSKERKSKTKPPEGKYKDISSMFQQKTSNIPVSNTKPMSKQKLPILKVIEDDQTLKELSQKKKTSSKPLIIEKEPLKPKSITPAKTPSEKKKKTLITDSSEEYDFKEDKSSQMDLDESPKEIRNKRQKSNDKMKKTPETKKKNSRNKDKSNNKTNDYNNEIIGPLSGKTIVVTGVFPMSRDEITNTLKGLGAKVTGSVSAKTSILLHGDKLEDGRDYDQGNKYKSAKQKHVTIYSMDDFEEYMRDLIKDDKWTLASASSSALNDNSKPITLGKTHESSKKKAIISKDSNANQNELWSNKYKPKNLDDIVGNQKNIANLIQWLDDWDDVVLRGNKKKSAKPSFRGGRPQFDNINAKACLITGDPGIGKTSSVRLISQLKGYKAYETNASEQRNKGAIQAKVGFLFDNTTLYTGDIQTKNVIIMDEIDGIGGNEDRGGIAALIEIIKKTKTPIICIANDRQNAKLRSLANHCYDLKFSKPDKRQVGNRLMRICSNEGIQVEQNALEFLCESVGNDIRQCINFLEFWAKTHKTFCFNDVKGAYNSFNKDSVNMISNFDAAHKLLSYANQKMSFRDKVDLFFIDYDLIPLLVQENYLSCYKNAKTKREELASIAMASEYISMGDIIEKRIRSRQDWTLLGEKGIMSSVAVNSVLKGSIPFPKFPEILGKMSSMKKVKREIKELKYCFPDVPTKAIKIEVAPLFLSLVTNELVEDNVEKCLQMMGKYKMNMAFFKENILDLSETKLRNNYDKIGSTVKAGFTREYNKSHKTVIGKSKKARIDPIDEEMEYDPDGNPIDNKVKSSNKDDDDDDDDNEEADNEEGNDKKTKKRKRITKAKPKTKGKSKARPEEAVDDEDDEPKHTPKPKAKTKKKGKSKASKSSIESITID